MRRTGLAEREVSWRSVEKREVSWRSLEKREVSWRSVEKREPAWRSVEKREPAWRSLAACLLAAALLGGCGDDGAGDDAAATAAVGGGASHGAGATGGSAPSGGSGQGAGASGGSGGAGVVPAAGFEPDEGFQVSGRLAHGERITIVGPNGAFGARAQPTPWLWDLVDVQYVGGVEEHAYQGIAAGDPIVDTVWTNLAIYQGWDTPEHRFKRQETALRHARATAQYGNLAAGPDDAKPYSKLGMPRWPQGWGTQQNAQMYVSWWQRMNGAEPGYPQDGDGNGGEDKPMRFGDTDLAGLGEYDITVAGLTATTTGHGNVKSWGSWPDPGAAWHRAELFVDRVAGIADMWVDGKLSLGENWNVNMDEGPFEFRPPEEWLFAQPSIAGLSLDAGSWQNVTIHWLGFDDGGVTQKFAPGRNVEIGEVYLDTTRARVEISTADTWDDTPDAVRTSEVQGRVVSWSDGEIEVDVHAGAFDSLAGLWLWVVRDDGSALRIGRFTEVE